MKILILILTSTLLILGFQNCAQPNSTYSCAESDCDGGGGPFPLPITKMTPIDNKGLQLDLFIGSRHGGTTPEEFSHRLEVTTETLYRNGNRAGCSVSQNKSWQFIKSLLETKGLCNYSYQVPEGTVVCMAMVMPFALAQNKQTSELIELSGTICNQSHTSVCGEENLEPFQSAFQRLEQDLIADAACTSDGLSK